MFPPGACSEAEEERSPVCEINRCNAANVHFWTLPQAVMCSSGVMRELKAKLEKLRVEAEDCNLISKLATDPAKRELFARLSRQLLEMAAQVEAVIAAKTAGDAG